MSVMETRVRIDASFAAAVVVMSSLVILTVSFVIQRRRLQRCMKVSNSIVSLNAGKNMVIPGQLQKWMAARQFRCFNSAIAVTPSGKWVALARYSNATHRNPQWSMLLKLQSHALWANFDPDTCVVKERWSEKRIIAVDEGSEPWRYSGPEDMRLFTWKGNMWAVYNTSTRDFKKTQMYICRLNVVEDSSKVVSITADRSIMLRCAELGTHKQIQKNWTPLIIERPIRSNNDEQHMDFVYGISAGTVTVLRCNLRNGVCTVMPKGKTARGVGSLRKSLLVGRDSVSGTLLMLAHRRETGFSFQYTNVFYIMRESDMSVQKASAPFFLRSTAGTYRDFDYVMSVQVHASAAGVNTLLVSGGMADTECFYLRLSVEELGAAIVSNNGEGVPIIPFMAAEEWKKYI